MNRLGGKTGNLLAFCKAEGAVGTQWRPELGWLSFLLQEMPQVNS